MINKIFNITNCRINSLKSIKNNNIDYSESNQLKIASTDVGELITKTMNLLGIQLPTKM